MRLQLLARAMERAAELDAEIVSVIHVVPFANRELLFHKPPPELARLGQNIHAIWSALTDLERFKGVYAEALISLLIENTPCREWAEYMRIRYGAMK